MLDRKGLDIGAFKIFAGGQIGQNVDIERNASISSKVHIGNHSGIGKMHLFKVKYISETML